MRNYTKEIKRQIRKLAEVLYKRELNQHIKKLDKQFSKWRKNKITPFELSEKIHEFHQNAARQLYIQYTNSSMLDLSVAAGIANGMLKEQEVSKELMEALKNDIAFQKDIKLEY